MTEAAQGPALVMALAVGVLCAAGVRLLLERSLTRILLGVILLGNGVNLLILMGGNRGVAPIIGLSDKEMSDPLPQAMILTAIVITLGITAFLLAMAYRSWALTGNDEVQDDLEDRRIVELAERDEVPSQDVGGEDRRADPEQVEDEDPGPYRPRQKGQEQ